MHGKLSQKGAWSGHVNHLNFGVWPVFKVLPQLYLCNLPSQHHDAKGLIFYRCGFFFLSFSTPNLWSHWTNLNQTWTHIHLWLLFEKFGPNSPGHLPPRARKQNKRFLGPTLNFDRTYLCNRTWYQQSEKTHQSTVTPLHAPQIWWTLVQKLLRTVGEFLPSMFCKTLPVTVVTVVDTGRVLKNAPGCFEVLLCR